MLRNLFLSVLVFGMALGSTASAAAERGSTADTIEYVLPRIVKIFGAGGLRGLVPYGTGFLVSKDGHIATAWSHLLDPAEVIVVLNDGRRYTAKVVGAEPHLEVAVLKIDAPKEELSLPFFSLEKSIGSASEGTRVMGFSNMFQVATGDEAVSVLHGVIASKTKFKARRGVFEIPYEGQVYVVDAITNNSGAAGGLLTTRDGRLLGMIGRELRNTDTNTWLNYSIPMSELQRPIEEIISGKFTSTKKSIDEPDAMRRYVPTDFGIVLVPDVVLRTPAYVDAVLPGSSAEKVGLKPDDLVLFINGELMQSVRLVHEEMGRFEAGDTFKLVVRRGDQLVTFELPIPKKPATNSSAK